MEPFRIGLPTTCRGHAKLHSRGAPARRTRGGSHYVVHVRNRASGEYGRASPTQACGSPTAQRQLKHIGVAIGVQDLQVSGGRSGNRRDFQIGTCARRVGTYRCAGTAEWDFHLGSGGEFVTVGWIARERAFYASTDKSLCLRRQPTQYHQCHELQQAVSRLDFHDHYLRILGTRPTGRALTLNVQLCNPTLGRPFIVQFQFAAAPRLVIHADQQA